MGWLGWTPDQALDTPMPLVDLALRSRVRMLQQLFGGAPEETPEPDDNAVAEDLKMTLRSMAGAARRHPNAKP